MLERTEIDRFLRILSRELSAPATVILTGGSEAMLLGGARPTGDIDFQLVLSRRARRRAGAVEQAVAAAAEECAVAVQWSEDVDRWSAVSVPRRHRRTVPHRRYGRLTVRLLEPTCWAVYKLARYLEPDLEDLRAVLRRQRVDAGRLARLCGEALRGSPRSTALFQFRRHVEDFLGRHGRAVWGRRFDPDAAVAIFHRAAGIPSR